MKVFYFLSLLTLKMSGLCFRISKWLHQSYQEKQVQQWHHIRGDKTLRLDYRLDETSIVFDLGGYEGQWASDIFGKYCCKIYVFEPVLEFAGQIEKRFFFNRHIVVHRFGLSDETSMRKIAVCADGSSIFKHGSDIREAHFVRAADFLMHNGFSRIDLMKINIEGDEYNLLDHLIETGWVRCIRNIQVQFHDFVPDAQRRMKEIQNELQKSHVLTFQYPFVWENWRIKEDCPVPF